MSHVLLSLYLQYKCYEILSVFLMEGKERGGLTPLEHCLWSSPWTKYFLHILVQFICTPQWGKHYYLPFEKEETEVQRSWAIFWDQRASVWKSRSHTRSVWPSSLRWFYHIKGIQCENALPCGSLLINFFRARHLLISDWPSSMLLNAKITRKGKLHTMLKNKTNFR